jgi:uncharacterized protein (TIGR03435 family)
MLKCRHGQVVMMNIAVVVAVSFGGAVAACGQVAARSMGGAQSTPAKQAFEAAAIHIVDPHAQANDLAIQPQAFPANRWRLQFITMKGLVCKAYTVTDVCNIRGGPPWLDSRATRYDITAKAEGNAMLSRDQMLPMLRTLLEERFHLKVHSERRAIPGYALTIAKGGPKLKVHVDIPSAGFYGGTEFKFQNVSAEYVGKLIGWELKQPVVDKTGLTGMYDVDLKFAPEEGSPLKDDPRFATLPSIFTAVQEQLGLKLVRQEVPQDYVVVDQVDKIPTEN